MVVLGIGVIWWEFGEGVFIFDIYLSRWIGVFVVFDVLFGRMGLIVFCVCLSGVGNFLLLIE